MQPDDGEHGEEGQNVEAALNDAVSDALTKHVGSYVTKWVMAVEALNAEGELGMWTFTSPNAKRWDVHGMLKEVDNFQIAHQVVEILEDHGRG